MDIIWPKDDSLAASSSYHVTQGHWAFDTANGSCWNTAAEYLTVSAADFVAVQEAKIPECSIADTEQAARNKGWRTAINPCIITAAEGKSAGTAVCSRTQIGSRNSFEQSCNDKLLQARFQMKHFGRFAREESTSGRATSIATGPKTRSSTLICCRTLVRGSVR